MILLHYIYTYLINKKGNIKCMDYYSSISTIKYSEFGTALKTAHECVIAEICLLFCDL